MRYGLDAPPAPQRRPVLRLPPRVLHVLRVRIPVSLARPVVPRARRVSTVRAARTLRTVVWEHIAMQPVERRRLTARHVPARCNFRTQQVRRRVKQYPPDIIKPVTVPRYNVMRDIEILRQHRAMNVSERLAKPASC